MIIANFHRSVSVTQPVTFSGQARRRMKPENNNNVPREKGTERKNEMSAQTLFTALNVAFLVLMGIVAVAGTSALVELVITLLRDTPRPTIRPTLEPEDA